MKKILLLLFIFLFSCSKNIDNEKQIVNNDLKNTLSWEVSIEENNWELYNSDLSGNKSENIVNNHTDLWVSKDLNNDYEKVFELIKISEKNYILNLDCSTVFTSVDLNKNLYIKKCEDLKSSLKSKETNKISSFSMDNCYDYAEYKYSTWVVNKNEKEKTISDCKMKVWLTKWCDLLETPEEKSHCTKLKEMSIYFNELKLLDDIDLKNYIK